MDEHKLSTNKVIKVDYESGNKPAEWAPAGRHYVVYVKIGRRSTSFDFWDSYHNAKNKIKPDMRGALACWASDALIELFDSYEDLGGCDAKTIRACIKALKEAHRIGLTDEELQELSDY